MAKRAVRATVPVVVLLACAIGFVLGYVGTIPAAGPLAIWIVRASLEGNSSRVFRLALGGALAEALWTLAAAYGLAWSIQAMPRVSAILHLVGPSLALIAGVALLFANPTSTRTPSTPSPRRELLTGFTLVALNPSFLATWTVSCALLRSHALTAQSVSAHSAPWLALGAFAGVLCWFLSLDTLLTRHRQRWVSHTRWLLRGMGALLIALGLYGFIHAATR